MGRIKCFLKKTLSIPERLINRLDGETLLYDFSWIKKSAKLYKLIKVIFPFYRITGFLFTTSNKIKKAFEDKIKEQIFINSLRLFFKDFN